MAFNVLNLANVTKSLLNKHNTSTSETNLSQSMTVSVQEVVVGFHGEKPVPNILYPRVWVEAGEKNENFGLIGNVQKRNIEVTLNIVGITNYGLGQYTGRELADQEMLRLSANIETILRAYPRLSTTAYVLKTTIIGTEYDVSEANDTYVSIAKIGARVNIWSD